MAQNSATYTIGWVGLGNMGLPMAQNLQSLLSQAAANAEVAGRLPFPVHPSLVVYNRTQAKCASVVELGATAVSSVAEVARTCDLIFTSLTNDQTVRSVYNELLPTLRARQEQGLLQTRSVFLIETSTTSPQLATELSSQVQLLASGQSSNHPVYFLRCPVFGAPVAAQSASLVWVLSGPAPACVALKSIVIPALGRGAIEVGEDPVQGSNMKLLGNFFIGSTVETLSEAAVLAEKAGLGTAKMAEFVEWMFPFGTYLLYSRKMVRPEEPQPDGFITDVGFSIDLCLKDVNLIRELARKNNCQLPTMDAFHRHLTTVQSRGHNDWDWSSAVAALRWEAGLPGYYNDTTFPKPDGNLHQP
ncbi:6-phosphogluconate dehydrogenase [Dimargaris cristalligena]|uniref:6-phosphogluconate dehydrogenase n=1 Tax=Dimargaris cristalligena TaxID=215637 RepID=A0A4P9ZT36_9FUNG|nr:6-phosphogluconate dehydrogenase [Dimargaris cristalligena]|eukprot:RKP35892.1 6-phosphogluconate dehydrogenase [Dimargaris cristalligena]